MIIQEAIQAVLEQRDLFAVGRPGDAAHRLGMPFQLA